MTMRQRERTTGSSNITTLPAARPSLRRTFPGVAVCVSGACSDPALVRRTAQAVIDQDYAGSIVLILPEGTAADQRWIRQGVKRSREVVSAPRDDACFDLDSNTAFAIALQLRPSVEFVAVLKCGQAAPTQWLSVLMKAQQEFDADLVVGPVKAVFDEAPADWMLSGTFFDRFGLRRGPIARVSAADNLLIRASVISSCLPRALAPEPLSEDSDWIDFVYKTEALGFASICANDAVVFDVVPKSRMTKEWLIAKEYDEALADTRAQSLYKSTPLADTVRGLRAYGLLVSGLISCGWSWFDEAWLLRARLKLAHAQGMMMARAMARAQRGKEAA